MEELIIKERQLKQQIAQLVSNSGLPAILLKPMFKDFLEQLNTIEVQQYSLAMENLEAKAKEAKAKEQKNKDSKKGEK